MRHCSAQPSALDNAPDTSKMRSCPCIAEMDFLAIELDAPLLSPGFLQNKRPVPNTERVTSVDQNQACLAATKHSRLRQRRHLQGRSSRTNRRVLHIAIKTKSPVASPG